MVFDADYNAGKGLAVQAGYILNDNARSQSKWRCCSSWFENFAQTADDPMMWGGVLGRWDANWIGDPDNVPRSCNPRWARHGIRTLGELGFARQRGCSNINAGNTRFGTNAALGPVAIPGSTHAVVGNLVNDYSPFVFDAGVTITLEKIPFYSGNFPIRVAGEYMYNPRADENETGWWAGVFFGKASKKNSWEVSYRYKRLESDAWYEEFVDSDFGAYYPVAPQSQVIPPTGAASPTSGFGSGYRSGTGVEGHIVKVAYALSDSFTIGGTWFYTHLVDEPSRATIGKDPETGQHRVQVDAMWKF
jgi:hypothetical protein